MFALYDRYLMRQLLTAAFVVALSLSMVVLLTQSLRLIELVLQANASGSSFMTMMALSMPRFFEAVLPVSLLVATLFVLNRMGMDSELVVLRAGGASPWRLARPVMTAGVLLGMLLLVLSLWISPLAISRMQALRTEIRNQYTHLLFREGVFNSVGRDLTAYVRARTPDGQLIGLMVHDTRGSAAVTVVARGGHIINEKDGQKIVVYDGSRQESDPKTGKFSQLDFKQYTLDLPDGGGDTGTRWREPDERTLGELTDPVMLAGETPVDRAEFRGELHRRFSTPLLLLAFGLLGAVFLLQGPFTRRGQMPLIIVASVSALAVQSLYLLAFSAAKKTLAGCLALYGVAALPALLALVLLTPAGDALLRSLGRLLANALHVAKSDGRRI